MRKFRLIFISLLILVASLPLFNKAEAFAEQNNSDKVQTGIFLPTSYLQYYKLDNPYAICRYKTDEEDFVAISQKNSIVIYRDEKFSKIMLDNDEEKPITTLQRYENYLLYLYKSVVWALDISDFDTPNWQTPEAEKISNPSSPFEILASNSSFSVYGNRIVCFDSEHIYLYELKNDAFNKLTVDLIGQTSQDTVTKLLLSKNGNVYFAKNGEKGIFVWDGQNDAQKFFQDSSMIRSLTESEDGSTLYYSCVDGIFSIDCQTLEKIQIKGNSPISQDADLGEIYDPQGICIFGQNLWVVDSAINAVQEIDLNDSSFTEFAITTNSTAVNRLTAGVKDIVVDKDVIYALDNGRIVAIKNINSKERQYSRINLGSAPVNKFSAGNGYICYSTGNKVSICKFSPIDSDEIEFELSDSKSLEFSEASEIQDISYSEGYFYVAFTSTYNNVNHPCIYKINTNTENFTAEKVIFEDTEIGSALEVIADVFGTVYYCTKNVSNYEFYSYDGKDLKLIATRPCESEILNLQTDFDGKLFALYEENAIDVIEENNKVTSKKLDTSANLGSITPAKSMCLSYNSQTAYFIFEGLILSTSNPLDLNVSTPHTISIPKDFTTAFNQDQTFAKIKVGAKLFEIDVTDLSGEYFKFIDNFDAKIADTDYTVIPLSEKYSLLIKDGVSAVARNSDIVSTYKMQVENLTKFAVVGFTPYSIPVLESPYKTQSSIDKYQTVEITGKITFNGINYFVVKNGENYGYIPETFLVDTIITEGGNLNVSDVYVYKKGGISVYDSNGNQIGTIDKKTKVTVIEKGSTLTILYGSGVGYINSDCIVSSSKSEILKSIAIILGALSLCVTALYFEKRYLLIRR